MEQLTVVDNRFGRSEVLTVEAQLCRGKYPLITLYCADGQPHSTATVNLDEVAPAFCIWVKDYSENEGMVKMLVAGGLIDPDIWATTQSGYAVINAYRMTEKLLRAFEAASPA